MPGLGYWGPNLARNFDRIPDAELAWLCDESEERVERHAPAFPGARGTTSLDDLLADDTLDAVALATPVPATPPSRCGCSRRASTASSRSRSPSRSTTPSRSSPRPRAQGAC